MHGEIPGIAFRTVIQSDVQDLRDLYKECFPVSYPESWFTDLTKSKSLISFAAVSEGHIVGVLVARFSTLEDCNAQDREILDDCFSPLSSVAYIMSLGVTQSWRSRGVASQLLRAFISYASGSHYRRRFCDPATSFHSDGVTSCNSIHALSNREAQIQSFAQSGHTPPVTTYRVLSDLLDTLPPCPSDCCVIYLHVLRTNTYARRFYENRGFYSLHVKPGCYYIAGKPADGCTYVMHINGGYATRSPFNTPVSWTQMLERIQYPWFPGPVNWFVQLFIRFGQAILSRIYPSPTAQRTQQ